MISKAHVFILISCPVLAPFSCSCKFRTWSTATNPTPWQDVLAADKPPDGEPLPHLPGFTIPGLWQGSEETHFLTPSRTVNGQLSSGCLLFKLFFLRVFVPHEWTSLITNPNSSLAIPPHCIHLVIFSHTITLYGVMLKKIKDVLLWKRAVIISEASCGRQTLKWPQLSLPLDIPYPV